MSAHDSMYFDGIHSSQFLKNREQKSAEQFTNTMTNHRFFFFQRTNVKNFFFGIPWVRRKSTLPPNLIISCSRRVQRTSFKENFRSHRRLSGREDFLSSNKKNTTRKGKLFAMIFQVQSWHDKSLIWKGKKSFATTPGTHTIRAVADDVNRINESDETNNAKETTLTINP